MMVAASFQNRKKSSSGYLAKGGIRGGDRDHRCYKNNPSSITGATSSISNTAKPASSLTRRDSNNTIKHIQ